MQNLKTSIRSQLLVGFATVAVILAFSVIFSLIYIDYASKGAYQTIEYDVPLFNSLVDLGTHLYDSQASLNDYASTKDIAESDEFKRSWNNITKNISIIDSLISKLPEVNIISKWQSIKSKINELKVIQSKIQAYSNIDKISLYALIKDENSTIKNIFDELDGHINDENVRAGGLFDMQLHKVTLGTELILSNLNQIKIAQYVLLLIITIISSIIAIRTANKITKPLNYAIDIAKRIATGERAIIIINETTSDETGVLLSALKDMQKSIVENENKIKESDAQSRLLYDNLLNTAGEYSKLSNKVAKGDLRQRIYVKENDILAQLGNDLNTMADSLTDITKNIMRSSDNMTKNLSEVIQAVDVQSSGASEQSSSINQITASLDEIDKSSSQTMEKAKSLGLSAERTREKGQKGLEAVNLSIHEMNRIKDKVQMIAETILILTDKTQQVGEITAVVNTLAQQSKMLALNASIEAAKAGEAGKGFAIVAAEVKSLAEQSEQSTKQVQKILEDIKLAAEKAVMVTEEGVKGVDQGATMVVKTGEIIQNLAEVIQETSVSSQQIEAAVRQESIGIEQIAAGMNEINQVTSSFVASSKQTSNAISNLADIAANIKEFIQTYKISQE
jgi:methyl-accepting chemotaxis protein